jgi:hypothetical protein
MMIFKMKINSDQLLEAHQLQANSRSNNSSYSLNSDTYREREREREFLTHDPLTTKLS